MDYSFEGHDLSGSAAVMIIITTKIKQKEYEEQIYQTEDPSLLTK